MFTFQSCLFEDDLVFVDSASERLINALKADNDSLQSAGNGWAMEYFATKLSPGYTMLVKFDNAGNAIFAGKSELTKNIYASDTSSYQMIGDAGPVLTFDTYNKILHAFSEPDFSGLGLEGDYEFIVMKTTANQMILKGKKRGTTIIMNKLPENVSWTQYFADLDAMNSMLFGNNAPNLSLSIVDKYIFSKGASHIFNILKDSANSNTSTEAPFIVTRTGIRFQANQELDRKSFQTFTLNADKSALVSNESAEIKIVGPASLQTYFDKNINSWKFDPLLMSSKVKAVYDLMVRSSQNMNFNDPQPNVTVKAVVLTLTHSITKNAYVLKLSIQKKSKQHDGELYLTATTNEDFSLIFGNSGDNSGLRYYEDINSNSNMTIVGFKEMVAIISSKFTLSSNALINPQAIKFTQNNDADAWFTLTRN